MDSIDPKDDTAEQSGRSIPRDTVWPARLTPVASDSLWPHIEVKALSVGIVGWHAVLILSAAYLLFGLVGHDPWKQDETYAFGIVYQFLFTHTDWLVPTLANEPFMEKPPLLYWIAAGFARAFSAWLPLHDGARLAIGFCMALTCAATGWTARHWWGKGYGRLAILALLSCLGLLTPAHLIMTDMPLLTGFAIAICGIALGHGRPLAGGLLLGTGIGIGFLAKGLIAPGVIGITWALLPVFFPVWRTRNVLLTTAVTLLAASPWLLMWPIALYHRSHSLFIEWFWQNNIGRFAGFSVQRLGADNIDGFWWHTILWFTFPALPLAVVTVCRYRKRLLDTPSIQACLALSLVTTTVLILSASARENYFLPLLIPICLLAAPAALHLNAVADKTLYWTAKVVFGIFSTFLWIVWIVMMMRGAPPTVPVLSRLLPLDFEAVFHPIAFVLAVVLTLAAVLATSKLSARPRGLTTWVIGITLVWGLLSTLWLPWINDAKSYRAVFSSMKLALGTEYNCVFGSGLGESERGMLHYVANIITKAKTSSPETDCDYWLSQGSAKQSPTDVDRQQWTLIWQGARSGDMRERFYLFKAARARIAQD